MGDTGLEPATSPMSTGRSEPAELIALIIFGIYLSKIDNGARFVMGPRATYLPIASYPASHRYRYESGLPALALYKLPHRSGALPLLLGGHSV